MTNSDFLSRVFAARGPKILRGFSRPLYHNLMGFLYGHQFNKAEYGGMIRHTEGAMLYKWASQLPPTSVIVEIGCYGGLSTSYLAKGCRKNSSKIYAIDPFDSDLNRQEALCDQAVSLSQKPSKNMVAERLRRAALLDRVELIEGFSQDVVKTWTSPVHFLWIDGNHEQAYQDYLDWSPFLVPGARLAIHDAHPRFGIAKVAEDARRIFNSEEWTRLEHVKSTLTGVRQTSP
jgi:predicted O-methyltransferase YrrM